MQAKLVVVADPNAATRELLDDVFRSEFDAYVTLVPSVSELEPTLRESVPALVVVEIGRDRRADVDAIRRLKDQNRRVPFLVLTAWGVELEELEGNVGAEATLQKPFELPELIATADRLMTGD